MTDSIFEHYSDASNPNPEDARFAVYPYSVGENLHRVQAELLGNLGRLASTTEGDSAPVVLDAGSSKGDMLAHLTRAGFQGSYIGLDFSYNQLVASSNQLLFKQPNIVMVNGRADQLPVRDHSVDITLANFILYHQGLEERLRTYREFKRVMKPDAILGITTSSAINKGVQRSLEYTVADDLLGNETKTPKPMNLNLTSEKAERELPENFPDWHFCFVEQIGRFEISDEERVDVCVNSIRTLRDQFRPEPTPDVYNVSMSTLKQRLMQRIADGHPLVDNIHRTLILASPKPLGLPSRIVLGE
jgi:ubiquinone/menaquinone biosynthesis C-methylase UbiE